MPDILWHGSPRKLTELVPNQACDTGFAEGCQLAVYATSNRNMAICFALGCIDNDPQSENEASRTMMPEYGDKMVFEGCHPDYGGKGYLYKLDGSEFVHAMGSQWISYKKIVPIEIIEIDVNDHLDLCIVL
ncbi:MAG: hypothetical protein J6X66_11880 [Lachnospiraceae bacterium]|nr:hypothetical protein [Lachnospiraceae bacterium]